MEDQSKHLEDVPKIATRDSKDVESKTKEGSTLSDWKLIAFGQAIALSLACCSVSSAQLQNMNGISNMPLFQISFGYFFLQLHFLFLKRSRKTISEKITATHNDISDEEIAKESTYLLDHPAANRGQEIEADQSKGGLGLHSPWYFYALIAFLDVQSNYFVILSFRYTAVVNSTILTSLSVISVMATSKIILKRVFKKMHIVGAILCVFGASCILSLDFKLPTSPSDAPLSKRQLLSGSKLGGDAFAIIAALLFGLNDTLAEYTVQNSTRHEYLAMMGFFGFVFSFCESLILEKNQILEFIGIISDRLWKCSLIPGQDEINFAAMFSLWAFYIFTFYTFYASASRFLTIADATLLSLSLQASNVWTLVFSIFVQNVDLNPFFFFGASIIILGVWLYELGPPSSIIK